MSESNTSVSETTTTTPAVVQAPPPPPPPARAFPVFPYVMLVLLSVAGLWAGLALMNASRPDPGVVTSVRLTAKPDLDLKKIEEVLDTPDYYLELTSGQGAVRTDVHKDMPLGSGLDFKPPVPVPLGHLTEVRVFDANTIGKDSLVDRIDHPARQSKGEKFVFTLEGPAVEPARDRQVGVGLAGVSAVVLVVTGLKFVRAQVV